MYQITLCLRPVEKYNLCKTKIHKSVDVGDQQLYNSAIEKMLHRTGKNLHRHRLWCLWQIWGMHDSCPNWQMAVFKTHQTQSGPWSWDMGPLRSDWWGELTNLGNARILRDVLPLGVILICNTHFLSLKLTVSKGQHFLLGGDGSTSSRWWLKWK